MAKECLGIDREGFPFSPFNIIDMISESVKSSLIICEPDKIFRY